MPEFVSECLPPASEDAKCWLDKDPLVRHKKNQQENERGATMEADERTVNNDGERQMRDVNTPPTRSLRPAVTNADGEVV